MMNLIRMNLYRFLKAKSVYILLLVTALLIGDLVLDQNSSDMASLNQEILQEAGVEENDNVGLTVGLSPITSVRKMTEEMVNSGIVLVFTAIFAALFSNAERVGGYLKNLNSCAGTKEQIFMAKIVPVILFALLNILVIPLTAMLFGLDGAGFFAGEVLIYLGVQWLLHIAFGISILMLMEVTRSLVAGILSGVFIGAGVGVMLINLIENIVFRMDGFISGHLIVLTVKTFLPENVFEYLIPVLVRGIVGFVLYTGIGALVFKKRDIY